MDVESIHGAAFAVLWQHYRQIEYSEKPMSVIVTGEPGSGKTHLLARLRRKIEEQEPSRRAWYVYMPCTASARTIWRHLQWHLAESLLERMEGGEARFIRLLQDSPQRIARAKHLAMERVLTNLAAGRHLAAAKAWLRGEQLTEEDLAPLGVAAEKEGEEHSRDMESALAVKALLRVLWPDAVVICFDQVEALETYPGEQAGYHALGQTVAALVDGDHQELLLISCILTTFEPNIERIPNGADRDRWLQDKAQLAPIPWEQGKELVEARLRQAEGLRALRARHKEAPLWPLEEGRLQRLFEATGRCLPRKLIQECRAQFAALMGDVEVAPPLSKPAFLQQELEAALAAARQTVKRVGGEQVLEDGLPWLLQRMGWMMLGKDSGLPQAVNTNCRTAAGDVALVYCFKPGVALTNRLKKLDGAWSGKPKLVIVSDGGMQPKPGSVGATVLAGLKAKGARQVHPLPEALAALQAIRELTARAKAGDLSLEGEPVGEEEASEWLAGNLPPALERLREELEGKQEAAAGDANRYRLAELLRARKLLEAREAARELQMSEEEVAACARRHPMQFGLLEGPPVVLFEAVEGTPEAREYA